MRRVQFFFAILAGPYLIFLRRIRIGNVVVITKNRRDLFLNFIIFKTVFVFYIFTVYSMNSIKMLCI